MEENPGLVKREAWCSEDDHDDVDEDKNIDPDVDFAYIGEKLENVLGHFQREFECGVAAEKLGVALGGYGSFLPLDEHSPSIWSQSKSLQRSNVISKCEGASSLLTTSPIVPSYSKPETDTSTAHSSYVSMVPSGDDSVRKHSCLSSNTTDEVLCSKNQALCKPNNQSDQKNLKFRIKMASGNMKQPNAALYSGLGLDDSPSSSSADSPEASQGTPVPCDTMNESPTRILQVMTSFPVPEGSLVSPLHDSMLCLIRKDTSFNNTDPMPTHNFGTEESSKSVEEPPSLSSERKTVNKKNIKAKFKNENVAEFGQRSGLVSNTNMKSLTRKSLESGTCKEKWLPCDDVKSRHIANDLCDVEDSNKVSGNVSKVCWKTSKDHLKGRSPPADCWKTSKDHLKGRSPPADLVREDSRNLVSTQESAKCRMQNAALVEKVGEHSLANSYIGVSEELRDNSRCKASQTSSFLEVKSDVYEAIGSSGVIDSQKQTADEKAPNRQRSGTGLPYTGKKLVNEGKKKSKGIQSGCRQAAPLAEVSKFHVGAPLKNQKGGLVGDDKSSKNYKPKSKEEIDRVHSSKGSSRESLGIPLKQMDNQIKMARPSIHCTNASNHACAISKRRLSAKRVDDHLMPGGSPKNGPNMDPDVGQLTAPVLIQEDWVGCDNCKKWRLLPFGIKPEHLPDKWFCSMLDWLPGMNRCDISQDETTKALRALYQVPVSEGQNHLQTHADGSSLEVTFGCNHIVDQNNQNMSSGCVSISRKKKHGLMRLSNTGSSGGPFQSLDVPKNQRQELVKSTSISDKDRLQKESKPMINSRLQHAQKSQNLRGDKNMISHEEKQKYGGVLKKTKMRNYREADQYGSGMSKKLRTECTQHADKHRGPDVTLGRVGISSSSALPSTKKESNVQECDGYCLSEDPKRVARRRLVIPIKRSEDRAQVSSNSLDIRTRREGDLVFSKGNLKDQQEDQVHNIVDTEMFPKGSSESGFKKAKKVKIITNSCSDLNINDHDDRSDRKGMVTRVFSVGDRMRNDDAEVKFSDQKPKKHQRKVASELTLKAAEALRSEFGPDSLTITPSSSKVSSFHKYKSGYEEGKASPVESVSSSPWRTSNSEKHPSAREKVADEHDAVNGGIPALSKHRQWSGGETVGQTKQFGKCREKPFSGVQSPFSEKREYFQKRRQRAELVVDVHDSAFFNESERDIEHHLPDKCSIEAHKDRKNHFIARDSIEQPLDNTTVEHQKEPVDVEGSDIKSSVANSTNDKVALQQNTSQDPERVSYSNQHKRCKVNAVVMKSRSGTHGSEEIGGHQPRHGTPEDSGPEGRPLNASKDFDMLKPLKQPESGNKNGDCCGLETFSFKHGGDRDLNDQNTATGKVSSSQFVAIVLKEAKDLRHQADRLKSSSFGFESNEAYLQAALKFLQGASLLEACDNDSGKHEISQLQTYRTAARLCQNCAHEYERCQEMAAAALAFKCMEVAYMRLVYCKHSTTSRDQHEMLVALHMETQGESPSSSASEIDNSNNQATVDKGDAPQSAGHQSCRDHVGIVQNRLRFVQLLDFTQDISYAMDASRKALIAFAAANQNLEKNDSLESITSLKEVIDFSFQDVGVFIPLVERAMTAIRRLRFGGSKE